MNRRQLFTRLSAIALAPLAKLLPKPIEPDALFVGSQDNLYLVGCDVAGEMPYHSVMLVDAPDLYTVTSHSHPERAAQLQRAMNNLLRKQLAQTMPIPQEET